MTLLAPLITGYLRDYMLRQRGYSPHSCETYAHSFRLLFAFAAKRTGTKPSQLHVEQLDAKLILDFLAHIESERHNGAATRNLRLAAIKSLLRYVEYRVPSALEQIGQIQAIPTKRHDQRLIGHLTMEEVRAILNAPDITTRLGIRDRAMLHLCFAAGLRVSELVGVPLENLSLRRPPSVLIRGKGRKERSLPLWKETTADLRAWLAVRGPVRASELFVNAEGAPMTRAGFEYVLDKHTRAAAKICPSLTGRSVSPHQLRHSCAVIMLQATRDIRKVALWLGHADIRTTEVYLRMDATEKLEAVEAVLPPELRRGRFKAPDALIASLMDASPPPI
jgi:integrase/recombinase XerD